MVVAAYIISWAAFRTWLLQCDRLYGEELLSTYGNPQSHSGQATTKQIQEMEHKCKGTNKQQNYPATNLTIYKRLYVTNSL